MVQTGFGSEPTSVAFRTTYGRSASSVTNDSTIAGVTSSFICPGLSSSVNFDAYAGDAATARMASSSGSFSLMCRLCSADFTASAPALALAAFTMATPTRPNSTAPAWPFWWPEMMTWLSGTR